MLENGIGAEAQGLSTEVPCQYRLTLVPSIATMIPMRLWVIVVVALVGEEVPPADVAGDLREVFGGLRHRRAVVEATPNAGVLDVSDDLVEVLVSPRRADDRAGDRDRQRGRVSVSVGPLSLQWLPSICCLSFGQETLR
jgi:hypothetical protein